MLIRTLLFLLLAFPAFAAPPGYTYAVGTGATPCASIQAADAAYCTAIGCDGVQTKYWFPVIVLNNGTCAVQIVPGDPYYGVSVTLPPSAKFPSGITLSLTTANLPALNVALVSRASIAALLPNTVPLATFEAPPYLTAAQLTALNSTAFATAHPVAAADWAEVKAAGYVDMQDPTFLDLATQALALGDITQAQYTLFTTPTVTAPGP
jgi:hypothetical protein